MRSADFISASASLGAAQHTHNGDHEHEKWTELAADRKPCHHRKWLFTFHEPFNTLYTIQLPPWSGAQRIQWVDGKVQHLIKFLVLSDWPVYRPIVVSTIQEKMISAPSQPCNHRGDWAQKPAHLAPARDYLSSNSLLRAHYQGVSCALRAMS
jgi:hypothetical protein